MLDFVYENATKIVFGAGQENSVGELVLEHSRNALLLYGGGSVKRSGLLGRVQASLDRAGVCWTELGGVKPNPRLSLVREGIAVCREKGIDFVLAVGGGSVIDTAKAIALGVPYEGDVWDFFTGRPFEGALSTGVILTIPAAGSESSCDAVITNEDGLYKRASCWSQKLRPAFAVLNPALTLTLPDDQTFAGVTDILVHIMERYFTNTPDVDVTDRMCEGLMQSVLYAGHRLEKNPQDMAARSELMWSGTLAHNNLLGVDREGDWGTHNIGHEISALYDVTHGATLSVVFPAWMRYTCRVNIARFSQFANRVFGVPYVPDGQEAMAREGIRLLMDFFRSIHMPTTFAQLGVANPDVRTIAMKCTDGDQKTVGKFLPLHAADVEGILALAKGGEERVSSL